MSLNQYETGHLIPKEDVLHSIYSFVPEQNKTIIEQLAVSSIVNDTTDVGFGEIWIWNDMISA